MDKALWFQFTVGGLPLYAVTFMGYWDCGSSTSTYLPNNINGPIWVKTLVNATAFLQIVIALHIFASPMYKYLDTKYGGGKGSTFSTENLLFRVVVRGGYLAVNTFVSALLPFIGDFISLTGAISMFPLTFVLGNHKTSFRPLKKLGTGRMLWGSAAAISALRLIVVDSRAYHLFADL